MSHPSDFFLTEEQLRERFEERVRDYVFRGYEPQESPVLVLLGGQPAAGKSQAMAATQQRHPGRQLVPLTGDELRSLHPAIDRLRQTDAQTLEAGTAQASGAWVRMSIEHALRERYSLILEGVFRDPDMTIGTARQFAAEQGYQVEIVALGVREERSRLDALHRFLDGGRWTPPALQDLAYRMVPETVAAAERNAAVTSIIITNRSGVDLYRITRDGNGTWPHPPEAVTALQEERARPFPRDEATQWLGLHRTVVAQMAARGEVNSESVPVLRQLTRDAQTVADMISGTHAVPPADPGAVLHRLTSEPLPRTGPLPPCLRVSSELGSDSASEAERRRRASLTEAERRQESELRQEFRSARERIAHTSVTDPEALEAARVAAIGFPKSAQDVTRQTLRESGTSTPSHQLPAPGQQQDHER